MADPDASLRVTCWAYANAVTGGASAWLGPSAYEPVSKAYVDTLQRLLQPIHLAWDNL